MIDDKFEAGDLLIHNGAARGTFSATLDTTRVTGTVAIARLDPVSVITFAVASPNLNIDTMARLVVRNAGSSPAPSTMRRLLARGTIKIDRLVRFRSPLEATQARGQLSIYTNTIHVDSYALSAYGGAIQGRAALDYSAAGLPATATTTVRGISIGRLLSALTPKAESTVTGTLEADLRLATEMGRDPEVALSGSGTFAVHNGSFPRLDLTSTMQKLATAVRVIIVPKGPTRFSYFGGDVRIARQRVYSNALRLEAVGLEATARGSFGFDATLAYVGAGAMQTPASAPSGGAMSFLGRMFRKVVPGTSGAAGVQVPFSLRGTFDDPNFSLAGTPKPIRGPSPQQQR